METETKHKLTEVKHQLDLTDRYKVLYPETKEYTFFSAPHGTFSKTHHIVCHKTCLKRYKKTAIIPPKRLNKLFNSNNKTLSGNAHCNYLN